MAENVLKRVHRNVRRPQDGWRVSPDLSQRATTFIRVRVGRRLGAAASTDSEHPKSGS
jgi:hypothetical protein